jgi:hypothetical protein
LEAVPLLGDLSAIVVDFAFLHQVDHTARRAFQERWLRDHGKVDRIRPAATSRRRSSILGLVRISREVAYMGGYSVGFGVTFSATLAARGAAALPPNAVVDGLRDGTDAAVRDARTVHGRRSSFQPVCQGPEAASATAGFSPATA